MTTATMRKKQLSNHILIQFVLVCGYCTSVLHGANAPINFTEFQQPGNRTVNVSVQTCSSVGLNSATSAVISAAAHMSNQALCAVMSSGNIPSAKLQRLHTQLGHIIQSALNFSTELNSHTKVCVATLYVSLEDLNETTIHNLLFVENWLYLKFLPVLSYMNEEIMTRLSRMNFTCGAFHVIVEVLSREGSLIRDRQQRQIFSHLIYSYLSRSDTADPGCFSNITKKNEWLQKNFGIFSKYATLRQLTTLNSRFTQLDSLGLLSSFQLAEYTATSGALNSVNLTNIIFDSLEDGDAFQNIDQFFWTLIQFKPLNISPVVRDIMMNRTFTVISLHFADFGICDWYSWFTLKLIPLLPSLTPEMLQTVTSNTDCNAYNIIVEALKQQEITAVLRGYLNLNHGLGCVIFPSVSSTSFPPGLTTTVSATDLSSAAFTAGPPGTTGHAHPSSAAATYSPLGTTYHAHLSSAAVTGGPSDTTDDEISSSSAATDSPSGTTDHAVQSSAAATDSTSGTTDHTSPSSAAATDSTSDTGGPSSTTDHIQSSSASATDSPLGTTDHAVQSSAAATDSTSGTTDHAIPSSAAATESPSGSTAHAIPSSVAVTGGPSGTTDHAVQSSAAVTDSPLGTTDHVNSLSTTTQLSTKTYTGSALTGEGFVVLQIRLEIVFISDYNMSSSVKYQILSNNITMELNQFYRGIYGTNFLRAFVMKFWPGSVGVDVQLIFANETVIPNATSIKDNLDTGIDKSKVFLGSVISDSITVKENSTLNTGTVVPPGTINTTASTDLSSINGPNHLTDTTISTSTSITTAPAGQSSSAVHTDSTSTSASTVISNSVPSRDVSSTTILSGSSGTTVSVSSAAADKITTSVLFANSTHSEVVTTSTTSSLPTSHLSTKASTATTHISNKPTTATTHLSNTTTAGPAVPGETFVILQIRLQIQYTEVYNDPASNEYQTLALNISIELNRVYRGIYGTNFLRAFVMGFWPGSVGVDTALIFTNETVLPKAKVIEKNLETAIVESRAFLGSVLTSSITVVEQQGTTLTTQASQNVPVTQTSSAVAPVLSSMLFMLLLLL